MVKGLILRVLDLMILAKQGDKAAENRFFEYLHARFTLIATRRVGADHAEDIAQEACITVLQKYRSGVPEDRFEAWAYQVLRNKIGNYLQGRDVRRNVASGLERIEDVGGTSSEAVDPALRIRLLDCLRLISRTVPRYARVLNLVHQGYSTPEICERMSVKPNHLYVILNRSRKMLSECLARYSETGK